MKLYMHCNLQTMFLHARTQMDHIGLFQPKWADNGNALSQKLKYYGPQARGQFCTSAGSSSAASWNYGNKLPETNLQLNTLFFCCEQQNTLPYHTRNARGVAAYSQLMGCISHRMFLVDVYFSLYI